MSGMKDMFGDELYFPPEPGRVARDAGIAKVKKNSDGWIAKAIDFVERMPSGWIGTGEDIKLLATPQIGAPHHPNAWGALTNAVTRRGLLVKTGRWLQTKGEKSHARNVQEYRRS